jgi:hypothetical protein
MTDLYRGLDDLAKNAKDWKCKLLFNQTADFVEARGVEGLDTVDLCDFLPNISLRNRKTNKDYPPGTNYMFPERFKGMASKELLMVELKLAGIRCGYSLVIRTSKMLAPDCESPREFQCTLNCLHGTIYKKNKSRQQPSIASEKTTDKKEYKTTTKRPTDKQLLCPFQIKVFLQKELATQYPGRWFLSGEQSSKCCHHCNHFVLDPAHLHVPTQLMTEEEKKLAQDCSQLYFTPSSSANLLTLRDKTGLSWKPRQLDYLSRKERHEVHGLSKDASSAEKLIESFKKR